MSSAATGGAVVADSAFSEAADPSLDVRTERETTPAPAMPDVLSCTPSLRPTSIPDFDVEALALDALAYEKTKPASVLPDDLTIPTRTRAAPPEDLTLRLAFVLLHVDGRTSIRDIANAVALPASEARAAFVELVGKGLVELGHSSPERAPISGEYDRSR